jgi:two-component sensor histidine kinase
LDVSQAVPLGLIVNEVVTNAIKYAFCASQTTVWDYPKIAMPAKRNHWG